MITTQGGAVLCFIIIYLCFLVVPAARADNDTEYAISLIKFKQSLTNATMLDNWKDPLLVSNLCPNGTPVWTGCLCTKGSFSGIKLEGMWLGGTIDIDAISELPLLSFSVMHNNFTGPFPKDINRLGRLRRLYLADNNFTGEVPDDAFSGMNSIRRVVIGFNSFTGRIPSSLAKLPGVVDLQIQNNGFEGPIPDFPQAHFDVVTSFANNRLSGPIPADLAYLNASTFSGNTGLCGKPLKPCLRKKQTLRIAFIIAAVVGAALAGLIILCMIFRNRSRPLKYKKSIDKHQMEEPTHTSKKPEKNHSKGGGGGTGEHGRLYFVRNDRGRFELEDLLRASAEVLGSGSFGSSYKAVLFSGSAYVVRRFRHMSNVGRGEFYEHMRRLGRLSHPNLLPLVAFYYRKEEKLLITDYVQNGSLASLLHGKRTEKQPGLDWPTRLKVIKGVARGLAYLYKEVPSITLPHGHLKSSNVLLNENYDPILADYALIPVINKEHAHQFMVAYKSPENDRVTRKTDVWSLGILILELLTGRFPANYLKQGRGPSADLATWVNSVVREEWTGEVFDKDMVNARNGEGQMLRLLKIGMCCCEWNVEKRWDLNEAVERIEELKERDVDDDYSSYASEGDVSSSKAMTDDDFSFSKGT